MFGAEGLDPRTYLRRLREPLHRNALMLTLNSIVPSFWGLAFWLLVARVYPARDVGIATSIFPTAGLIANLATLGFTIGLVRFLAAEDPRARDTINSTITLAALLALGGAAAFVLGAPYWSRTLEVVGGNPAFAAAFVLYTLAAAGSLLVDSALIARARAELVFLKTNVFGVARVPLPLLLFLAGAAGSLAIFISFSVAIFAAFALGLLVLLPRVYRGYRFRPRVEARTLAPLLRFSLANHLANILALVPGAVIPLLILRSLSAEEAAYYYAAWVGAGVVFSVSVSASTSLLAEGSRREAALERDTRKAWGFVLALQVPAVLLTLALADLLLDFFQRGYAAAGTMLRLFALASFFVAFNNIYLTRKRVEKDNWVIVGVVALQGVLNLLFALLLIPPAGLTGVGVAFLASQGLTAAVIAVARLAAEPAAAEVVLGEGPGEEIGKGVKPE